MSDRKRYFTVLETPCGAFVLIASARGLREIVFPQATARVFKILSRDPWAVTRRTPVLRMAVRELRGYLAGGTRKFRIALDPEGTAFQKKVWREISRIPWGTTRTYGEIAAAIGRPGAARAVGGAAGRNPLPIVVPCHRLVASGRGLGGFSGGLSWKRRLLGHEGVFLR